MSQLKSTKNGELRVTNFKRVGDWLDVKNAARATMGLSPSNNFPTSIWKRRILAAEHSPIRLLQFYFTLENVKTWVSGHFARHKIGVEHFISTQRTDRTGISRDELPQDTPRHHTFFVNAQQILDASHVRLCMLASCETREGWALILKTLGSAGEDELVKLCVPSCIYRGACAEMKKCGFVNTQKWVEKRESYLEMVR